MRVKDRPERGTVEHVPDEHVPPGPVVIKQNARGRLSGHLYDVASGVYMGPASDELKKQHGTTGIITVRHIKCRIEP